MGIVKLRHYRWLLTVIKPGCSESPSRHKVNCGEALFACQSLVRYILEARRLSLFTAVNRCEADEIWSVGADAQIAHAHAVVSQTQESISACRVMFGKYQQCSRCQCAATCSTSDSPMTLKLPHHTREVAVALGS